MPVFKRPADLDFPTTYYTFRAKDKDSDDVVEYRVQDLPKDRFADALALFMSHFLLDEPINSSRGVTDCPEALKEIAAFWEKYINYGLSIACFKNDGSNELVAVNVLVVCSKGEQKDDDVFENERVLDAFAVIGHILNQADIYELFNVSQYLTAYGLVVNPSYRGRGVATEILKARVPVMKAFGLTVTSTMFSAIGSQRAAQKAGFEDIYAVKYSELKEVSPQFNFLNTKTEFCKLMAMSISS